MRLLFVILWAFFSTSVLAAEEQTSIAEPQHQFSGKVEVAGEQVSGNTQNTSLEGTLELGHIYDAWQTNFLFNAKHQTESDRTITDYYETWLKQQYHFASHYYGFVLLKYREDTFSGIYSEVSKIAGLGYNAFTDQPDYAVDLELGYGARTTKKLVNGVLRSKIDYDPGIHLALYSTYQINAFNALQANILVEAGNDDDFIERELIWEHKLNDALHVSVNFKSRTLTRAGIGKERTDSNTNFSLGYAF